MIWPIISIAAALLAGCATVGGSKQTIAFDSRPRGLKLAINSFPDPDDSRTPFTEEVKRERQLDLNFHSGDFYSRLQVECQFRYGTVLLGNLGLAAVALSSPPLAATLFISGVGTDYLSGNAFDCPLVIAHRLKLPEAVDNEIQEHCAPVLILPPVFGSDDVTFSYAMVTEAQEFVRRIDQECRSFVSTVDTLAALKRSSAAGLRYSELFGKESERKLVQILRDTKAARGVDMRLIQQVAGRAEVEFKLWDLYTKQEITSFRKKFTNQRLERLKGSWFMQTLGKSLRLIPNSFALMNTRPRLNQAESIPVRDEEIKRESFISLLSVTSVQHPDQFETWDFGFEFGPSIFFDSIRNRVAIDETQQEGANFLKTNSPDAGVTEDFTGYAASLPVDAVLALHTPAGAFRTFFGLGTGFYKPTAKAALTHRWKNFPLVHFGLDWVAYSSRNVFFQIGFHGFSNLRDESIESRKYLGFKGWSATTVGVGYYFPDSQGYLQSLLAGKP